MPDRSWIARRIGEACVVALVLGAAGARAQMGVVDGGYWSNGQFIVVGWACDQYWDYPVNVTLIDPWAGSPYASALANDPSEPAVGEACGVPWATNLRFHIPIDGLVAESWTGYGIAVYATSNFYTDYDGNFQTMLLSNSWVLTYPDNSIRGVIDSVSAYGANQAIISGWACANGIAQSVWVHVYAGGPAGSGQWVTAGLANESNEPAVLAACNVGYGAYRFNIVIPFGPDVMMTMGGLKVYVHGISPIGLSNLLLANSGAFSLPGQRATVSGGCGYVPASWNVPYGAIVLTRSNGGPIRPVIDAVGEYFTHSMLSLGTSGIAHAEMKTPDRSGWPTVCSRPLDANQLQYGYPGAEQINLGGAYADMQAQETTPTYRWGDPARTAAIANWVINSAQTTSQSQSNSSIWIPRKLRNGAPINYSLYQYRNIEQTNLVPSSSVNNGMVCSTFLAYAHAQAGAGIVNAFTYAHPQVANAATALFSNVQNACNAGMGFWGSVLTDISCPFFNVCENAGDQVTNCMSSNQCATDDNSIWHSVRDNPYAVATSISPDRIAGRWPQPVGTSVWSYDQAYNAVVWNGPGPQYGCWN